MTSIWLNDLCLWWHVQHLHTFQFRRRVYYINKHTQLGMFIQVQENVHNIFCTYDVCKHLRIGTDKKALIFLKILKLPDIQSSINCVFPCWRKPMHIHHNFGRGFLWCIIDKFYVEEYGTFTRVCKPTREMWSNSQLETSKQYWDCAYIIFSTLDLPIGSQL